MLGEKCDHCQDIVFIRKQWNGLNLCLDCLDEARKGHIRSSTNSILSQSPPPDYSMDQNKRRCPNCGRVIPEDARICPYCERFFW